jgi:hypothetical protein
MRVIMVRIPVLVIMVFTVMFLMVTIVVIMVFTVMFLMITVVVIMIFVVMWIVTFLAGMLGDVIVRRRHSRFGGFALGRFVN